MQRKLKDTNTSLLSSIQPQIRTVSSTEIKKRDFKNEKVQKLLIKKSHLSELLYQFYDECILIGSNEEYVQQFSMLYFDTPELKMYFEHHNRAANRFQVYRKYKYNTGKTHLVVKHSDNKHTNHNKKKKTKYFNDRIPLKYFDYITKNANHTAFLLKPVLNCDFNRYLFTNISMDSLISVDSELIFWNNQSTVYLTDLAVITIKTKRSSPNREISNALKIAPVFPSGLNKFSIGMALTNPNLKQNMLKQKIYDLKKISNGN